MKCAVKELRDEAAACDSCGRIAFVLRAVDEAKLCEGCVEKSVRIDRQLAAVRSDDRVSCNDCDDRVDFDARIAVVVRACGGVVLCDRCKPPEPPEPAFYMNVDSDAFAKLDDDERRADERYRAACAVDARALLFGDELKEPS
jgi:hypothetical protein